MKRAELLPGQREHLRFVVNADSAGISETFQYSHSRFRRAAAELHELKRIVRIKGDQLHNHLQALAVGRTQDWLEPIVRFRDCREVAATRL